jgi:hypothetical protein
MILILPVVELCIRTGTLNDIRNNVVSFSLWRAVLFLVIDLLTTTIFLSREIRLDVGNYIGIRPTGLVVQNVAETKQ